MRFFLTFSLIAMFGLAVLTACNSAETRRLSSTRSNSTLAKKFRPPASLATLPSWPNGASTKPVGRIRVRAAICR